MVDHKILSEVAYAVTEWLPLETAPFLTFPRKRGKELARASMKLGANLTFLPNQSLPPLAGEG